MRRRQSRQVEIFNFSFLDILACTIGLLIFIMVMIFVLQSGSPVADAKAVVNKSEDRAKEIRSQATRDDQIADQLEAQLGQIHTGIDPQVVAQRDTARQLRDAAKSIYDRKNSELAKAQTAVQAELKNAQETQKGKVVDAHVRLDAAKVRLDAAMKKLAKAKIDGREAANVRFLPHARSRADAERFQILHLDCRANEVFLFEVSSDGVGKELGRSPSDNLGDGSEFARIIERHQRHSQPLVLLWVRPDGIHSFEQAMKVIPEGMDHGYEPADADWKFVSDSTGDTNGTGKSR